MLLFARFLTNFIILFLLYPSLHAPPFSYDGDTSDERFAKEIFGLSPLHDEHGSFFPCEIQNFIQPCCAAEKREFTLQA